MGEFSVNVIHSRDRGRGDFHPSARQLCYRCNARGDRFVYVGGSRKFACKNHYIEWLEASKRDPQRRIWKED
jgi:hypothetical protein